MLDKASFREGYAFLYTDIPPYGFGYIRNIGWDRVTEKDYDWNGLTRHERDVVLFQYTLSGRGEVRIHNETYSMEAGKAFFVPIPSDHHYYFPEHAGHWEFYYMMLPRTEAITDFLTRYGSIFTLSPEEEPIRLIRTIFEMAKARQIKDVYRSSALAVRFLMELHRSRLAGTDDRDIHPAVAKALHYMEDHYSTIEGLDEISASSGLSRYHFLRLFRKHMGTTPIEYLNKLRIEQAAKLLRATAMNLDDIAGAVGFANGNYFSKVFRHWVGTSPGRYREGKDWETADHLMIR